MMNWKITITSIISLLLLAFTLRCVHIQPAGKVLTKAKNKLASATVTAYKFRNVTDNKFNSTKYIDSSEVAYSKIENSLHGFGLFALWGEEEYIFDGNEFEKIDHSRKLRITYDDTEIKEDPKYFERFPFFSTNPFMIKDVNETDFATDAFIDGHNYFMYKISHQNASKVDSAETVIYEKFFFVNTMSNEVSRMKSLIIRNDDTLQVSNYDFTSYAFSEQGESGPQPLELDEEYRVLKAEDDTFDYIPIAAGDILSRKKYVTVAGKEVDIFGNQGKSSLIMFSFIGCTPCEKALRDFKQREYTFTDSVDLYFSSFQNEGPALQKYLQKKEFPYPAFGKESNMIEAFSLYHSPSFVLIDKKGEVLEVIEGYDEQVRDTLFQWLALKQD